MENEKKISVGVIVGPTASGKTALAVEMARRLSGEVISADSMQIYKGLPVSTACPTEEEKQGYPIICWNFCPFRSPTVYRIMYGTRRRPFMM